MTLILARRGSSELAPYVVALATQHIFVMLATAYLRGTETATAWGRGGRTHGLRAVISASAIPIALLSLMLSIATYASPLVFDLFGVSADVVDKAAAVSRALSAGMPAVVLTVFATFALEAYGRPALVTAASVLLVVSTVASALFLIGAGPIDQVGDAAWRAGLAVSLGRWSSAIFLLVYVFSLARREAQNDGASAPLDQGTRRFLISAGFALAICETLSAAGASAVTLVVARLGADALSGYQIALTLLSVSLTAASGFVSASGINIAVSLAKDRQDLARKFGIAGAIAVALIACSVFAISTIGSHLWAQLFTSSSAVAAQVGLNLLFVAGVVLFEGWTDVLIAHLRANRRVWLGPLSKAIAMWTCGVGGVIFATHHSGYPPPVFFISLAGVASFLLCGLWYLQLQKHHV